MKLLKTRSLLATKASFGLCLVTLFVGLSQGMVLAADKSDVRAKWHTPFDLYLTPEEAYSLKQERGDSIAFIDIRTRGEVKYIGLASSIDGHIPVRFLRDDYAWSERSSTYRTRLNPAFVEDVDRLMASMGLDRQSPIILMCQSGSRVPEAARLLHAAGFSEVYTQYQGFEGLKATRGEQKGHRVVNGWKNAGLPWSYQLDPEKMYFNFSASQ